mmetsp:Transcript_849/g.1665  ORF Transcript_849/g.1665 Transcript_849/m.1665 type:complete len:473 (-) Transcript_849:280-1698(-)
MSSKRNNNDNIDDKLHGNEANRACDVAASAAATPPGGRSAERLFAARGARGDLEEEEPTMRSVAVPAHRRVLHFEPQLKRAEAPRLSKQPTLSRGGYAGDQSEVLKTHLPKPIISTSKPPAKRWVVSEKVLTPRPTDFPPLEKTSRVVSAVTAADLAVRITDCLQMRSVKAKYSKTEVLAKCRSTDFVKFYIRLYSEQEGILVEVQKVYGDSMSFFRDSRAILDAAEGRAVSKPEEEEPLYLRLPVSQMEFIKDATLPPLTFEEESESVNIAAELLASHRSDSNMLGMESLVTLIDPLKSLRSSAVIAAKRVLCPEDTGHDSFNLHNYVMSLIIYNNGSAEAATLDGTAMENHYAQLRNLAISSVANAIALLLEEETLWESIRSSRTWYGDVLVPALVRDIAMAEECPHEACYASRCLTSLASMSESTLFASKIREAGGMMALKIAHEVGTREYALLAQDAGKCHQTILRCR